MIFRSNTALALVKSGKFAIFNAVSRWFAAGLVVLAAGCSSTPDRPQPQPLASGANLFGVQLAWRDAVGPTPATLSVHVDGTRVTVAGAEGGVSQIDAANGAVRWRAQVGAGIAAGVGGDGRRVAVATRNNEVVALDAANGQVLWRRAMGAQVFTTPLVAGDRVFVLATDRTVTALDGASGERLWSQQRPGDALVLQRGGVLLAVGDTLVAGIGGRLIGMNPGNGQTRWDAAIATPRGITDIERLVDLVAGVSRVGATVCVRAFQAAVGCVDTTRGATQWTRATVGSQGLSGDEQRIYGTEADGTVVAWRRSDGERAWATDRFKHRSLSAPTLLGRTLALGDQEGNLLLLSRDDGALLARQTTDGSAIVAQPVLAGNTLVVVTRNGAVLGLRPE